MPRIKINARQLDEFEDLSQQENWGVFGISRGKRPCSCLLLLHQRAMRESGAEANWLKRTEELVCASSCGITSLSTTGSPEEPNWDTQFEEGEPENRRAERQPSAGQSRSLERRQESKRWGREIARFQRQRKGNGKP